MQKTTKIILIVAILAFAAGGWYVYNIYSHESISYDYRYEMRSYYRDVDNNIHYASSGNVFVYAYITEINTGYKAVNALPNCYSFISSDGITYEWTTGNTDSMKLNRGETAHIISIYEVPSSVKYGAVVCNMYWVDSKLVEL